MKPVEGPCFYWQAHAKPAKTRSLVLDGIVFGYIYPNHKPFHIEAWLRLAEASKSLHINRLKVNRGVRAACVSS
jgi:hypothetical protein